MLLNILDRRKLLAKILGKLARYLVFAHTHRLGHILERVLRDNVVFALAQQQADGGIVMIRLQNSVHSRKIEIQLPRIVGLEFSRFQLDHHVTTQIEIVEEQINIEIVTAHAQMVLIPQKRKASTQFQKELGYILTMLRDRGEQETFRYLRTHVLRGKPVSWEEEANEE